MPFTPVPGTNPIEYTWTNGMGTVAVNNHIAAVGGVATGGAPGGPAATQLTAKDWAIAIDPRDSAPGAPVRPGGVNLQARYNTLGVWLNRAPAESARVFEELAESVRQAESAAHGLPTATPAARLVAMPAGTTTALAINSDMTGDLCWLIVAMKLCPELAVAVRIGPTEKHLRVCSDMIGQLVGEGLGGRTILVTGPTPHRHAPVPDWARGAKATHWHPVHITLLSLPARTFVESCLSTSRRVFEAAREQALDDQRSVADVACELFNQSLTQNLGNADRLAIDGAIQTLTTNPGCLSTHAGYILLANRVEDYNYQHNTTAARLAAVDGARGARRLVTFGRPPVGGGANHIDLYTNHARTDGQRAYFWAALKVRMRQLGRDVVIVGGRSGTFDIAYHSGEEPTGGGLCWDIAGAARRDPEVDRLQQQAGPGGNSGLSLAALALIASDRNNGGGEVGDIAARLTALLNGGAPGAVRNATFAVGPATQIAGAESQAMRNAEVGRALFQGQTAGTMGSVQLGTTQRLSDQIVSDVAWREATTARRAMPGVALAHPAAVPKPSPHAVQFRCPVCGDTQPMKARYRLRRIFDKH
ncbi:hypothetical protein [Corallococcus exiguus]|uniref:Uncharacterized protein n=1 Tax=Corallococcus exiguus TaxID=83462 RepID=A0A7X4YFR3_9BACT|nr:hypothetical protein [Corallococcus exiguus]NBC44396.1 hypothetical protein [Corallococcus exiguus]TNV62154.1 hypothetical protein FH620_19045 [Corallococcus exiguus]